MIADFGFGLIIAVLMNMFFYHNNPDRYLICLGPVAALIVDLDFLIYMHNTNWVYDRWTYRHRQILHHPIPVIFGGALAFSFVGIEYSAVWAYGTFYHFTHDTFNAWGICWLSPFCEFFIDFSNESPFKFHKNKKEQEERVRQYGQDKWCKNLYHWKSPNLWLELCILASGIVFVYWWL